MPDHSDHQPPGAPGPGDRGHSPLPSTPPDRHPPLSISAAVFLMYAGAAFFMFVFVLSLAGGRGLVSPLPVIGAILWTITARINRLGLPQARPVALVLGLLGIAYYVTGIILGDLDVMVGYTLAIVHAVAILALLFRRASSAYFASMRDVLRGYAYPDQKTG